MVDVLLHVFLSCIFGHVFLQVCFESLRFHLRLSVNGQMTCVQPNCHSAIQKCACIFYWKWPNGNLARHFKIKIIYILSMNGWMVIQMTCVWLNCHLTIHTQTQMETEGYRIHFYNRFIQQFMVRLIKGDYLKSGAVVSVFMSFVIDLS